MSRARPALTLVALVAAGGAVGTVSRYEVGRAFPVHAGHWPTTTFAINIAGAFLLGALLEWLDRHRPDDTSLRPLLGIGVLGAFTTFSTLCAEAVLLGRGGHAPLAVAYVASSVVTGLAAVVFGLLSTGWHTGEEPPMEGES